MSLLGKFWALAAVVAQAAALPTALKSRDIDSGLLSSLSLFEQYAAAAYCSNNHQAGSTGDISCSVGNCNDVQSAGATAVYEFDQANDYGDATGFIATDATNKLVVLSFRGSSDIQNWEANLNFALTDVDLCDGCQAHTGFWASWGTVSDEITSQIDAAMSANSGYGLVVTGHSLGGALAALAGTALRNSGHTLDLYTYGQPRVGNEALAQYMTNQGSLYRVTHTNDIVPSVPPESFGFSHASPEYWITNGDLSPVGTSDVQEIDGIDATGGNAGESSYLIDPHLWYFNAVTACLL
ncbi:extracellular lipase [Penicillium chermesinum]|uniref:Extracellular lipase n=1 Tax=Penicillium chermesinum TaxID=63820 RepID=A0A9W9PKI4_9EURO|nr:extracellular lipase [Penicillium chermesinum]KAJ5247757.1 extracellular lipase [Penicillium chermesinum]